MACELTILVTADAEKPEMLPRFFFAIGSLNSAVAGRVQILVLVQGKVSAAMEALAAACACPTVVVAAGDPIAANGYPIWDICAAVRRHWERIEGEYISFAHPEYLYGPDRLPRTLDWLAEHGPTIAVGNLRRPGGRPQHGSERTDDDGGLGDLVRGVVDNGDAECLRRLWPHLRTWHWIFWLAAAPAQGWHEDIFYARRDWLATLRFFEQDLRQPFQDVYDLMRAAFGRLKERRLAPACPRMPRSVNEVLHLPHSRPRSCFSRPVLNWFEARRAEWRDTALLRPELWEPFLRPQRRPVACTRSLQAFRRGPGGTVTRWERAFGNWLDNGGGQAVQEYLENIK
jgi:hypothetical protein